MNCDKIGRHIPVMDFNSPIFLFLFLPLFMVIYHLLPVRGKQVAGVVVSLAFYAWGYLTAVPIMLALVLGAYLLGLGISRWRQSRWALAMLWSAVVANVGLVIGFKLWGGGAYPLGLSYVTFQVMADLIEVYKKRVECEHDILRFAFYLLLFPKLPVGPIVRYSSIKDQVGTLQVAPNEAAEGLRRFLRGLAKKVLIADTLAKVVNPIFHLATPNISPGIAWLVLASYALQLFFDFSGYTDMAIGLGRMMGLRFVENFNFPYISTSIGDFWRRWHISLSSWFRDFVFYPLERRRLKWIGQPLNTLIVFVLVGLWHGLAVTFVLWGLLHGLALVFESTALGKKLTSSRLPFRRFYTLGVILLGWLLFRSSTPVYAWEFLKRLLGSTAGLTPLPFDVTSPLPFIEPTFIIAFCAGVILSLPVGPWLQKRIQIFLDGRGFSQIFAQILYDSSLTLLLVASIAATASSLFQPNIYGKF